jgi:CRP-like cAMP-binding protein
MSHVDQAPRRIEVGEVLTPDELLKLPFFKGISRGLLEKNQGAAVRRQFSKGEIICREGDEGTTAFYILEGKVDVFINAAVSTVTTEPAKKGWFQRMTSKLVAPSLGTRNGGDNQYIPIDASVDLSLANPIAKLEQGDLFGEMTCLNFYPRSATVRAAENTVVLEMLRNILQMLQKDKTFKASLDAKYRARTLDHHLRSVPIFKDLPADFMDHLRHRVELVQFDPDQAICKQGELADAFYLIRSGHVKVTQTYSGGDLVLAYISRGQYFGEIGLLGSGPRTATCTALDHVEAVRITKEDFALMTEQFPQIRNELEKVAKERLEANLQHSLRLKSVFLNDFLGQSLMGAQNLLVLDLEKCTRCDDCVRACASAHDGITRLIREGVRYDKFLVATSCRQCTDPLCMVGCPVGSIRRSDSLEISIKDWCIGCGLCAKQCPYDNINLHEFTVVKKDPHTGEMQEVVAKKATVCDLCGTQRNHEPACVYACPHDAAHRVEPQKFFELQTIELAFPDKSNS